MNIGKAIKTIRKTKNIRQMTLAYNANITQAYLSQIEKGKKQPSIDVLGSISNALGISTPILIYYSIDKNDVPEDRKEIYNILKPHLKKMVEELIFLT